MTGRIKLTLLMLLTLLFLAQSQRATAARSTDYNLIDIYLHTIDVGNLVFNNFGHTAVRVHNRQLGTDVLYNWGIFDFGNPIDFSIRFYLGDLNYKLGVYPSKLGLRQYQRERRKVWEDKLDFSIDQKKQFLAKLAKNYLPENRSYQYQYFFDNCSTRPRDFIDQVLAGIINQSTQSSSDRSFRYMVREGYASNPEIDFLLEIGMNSNLDRPMTQWEAMFHPLVLRQELLKVTVQGRPLIQTSKVLVDFVPPQPKGDIFRTIGFFLGVPVLILFVLLQWDSLRLYKGQAPLVFKQALLRVLAGLGLLVFLIGGIIGIALPANWLLSGHVDLHHNFNLMVFLPADLWLAFLCFKVLKSGQQIEVSVKLHQLLKKYLIAHLVLGFGVLISYWLENISQDLSRVSKLAAPYIIMVALLVNFAIKSSLGASHEPQAKH